MKYTVCACCGDLKRCHVTIEPDNGQEYPYCPPCLEDTW
jgi:hypothetical protein